jgi:hypothetical protein
MSKPKTRTMRRTKTKKAAPVRTRTSKRETTPTAAATETATYLYCIVHRKNSAGKAPARVPAGLPGAEPPRVVELGDGLGIVVATVRLEQYGSEAIERGLKDLDWVSACAVGHESVVEHFGHNATVVPMKLFTLFKNDERALAHVRKTRSSVSRIVSRIAGHEEYGVRVSFDESRARSLAAQRAEKRSQSESNTSGAAFLLAKKYAQDAARELTERARHEVDDVFDARGRLASDSRRRPPASAGVATRRMLLDAAFLVPRARVAQFRAHAKQLAGRLEPEGYDIALTGPWPAYNFIAETPS